ENQDYQKNHLHCWELILPDTVSDREFYEHAIRLIDQQFKITSGVELQHCNVLSLRADSMFKTPDEMMFANSELRSDYISAIAERLNNPLRKEIGNIIVLKGK